MGKFRMRMMAGRGSGAVEPDMDVNGPEDQDWDWDDQAEAGGAPAHQSLNGQSPAGHYPTEQLPACRNARAKSP